MTVVEEIRGAGGRSCFLHDNHSDIAELEINVPIHIERVCRGGGENGAGRQRKDLIIMAQ